MRRKFPILKYFTSFSAASNPKDGPSVKSASMGVGRGASDTWKSRWLFWRHCEVTGIWVTGHFKAHALAYALRWHRPTWNALESRQALPALHLSFAGVCSYFTYYVFQTGTRKRWHCFHCYTTRTLPWLTESEFLKIVADKKYNSAILSKAKYVCEKMLKLGFYLRQNGKSYSTLQFDFTFVQ